MTVELHTYIKCSKCGESVRASRHTPEECKENQIKKRKKEKKSKVVKRY